MPARLERRISALVVAAGTLAANGVMPITDGPVPTGKKWNVNLILQSTDGAATRNARLMLAGGLPAHGIMSLTASPVMGAGSLPWAVSSAGTYMAFAISGSRVDLYRRIGLTGLRYIDSLTDTAQIGNLQFSPDERWLAYTTSAFLNVFVRAVSSTGFGSTLSTSPALAAAAVATSGGMRGVSWSPTGAYLACITGNAAAAGRVSVFPFAAGVFGARVDPAGMTVNEVTARSPLGWAPDESAIAVLYSQTGVSTSLYGWPWAAGAPGAVSIKTDIQLGGGSSSIPGDLAWCPDSTTPMIAVMTATSGGAPSSVLTYRFTAGAWVAFSTLTSTNARAAGVGGFLCWLTTRQVFTFTDTGASCSWTVDATSVTGTLIATLYNTGSATPPRVSSACQFAHLNGLIWRNNAANTGVILETILSSAITLFPTIGITANNRVLLQGILLEEGDRLLIGTPAATDIYAVSGSAIEIG